MEVIGTPKHRLSEKQGFNQNKENFHVRQLISDHALLTGLCKMNTNPHIHTDTHTHTHTYPLVSLVPVPKGQWIGKARTWQHWVGGTWLDESPGVSMAVSLLRRTPKWGAWCCYTCVGLPTAPFPSTTQPKPGPPSLGRWPLLLLPGGSRGHRAWPRPSASVWWTGCTIFAPYLTV